MATMLNYNSPAIVFLFFLIANVSSFNLDTQNYAIFHSPNSSENSWFGFSVVGHRDRGKSWVMVGAPEAGWTGTGPKITKGGAVYRCDPFEERCFEVPFNVIDKRYINGTEIRQRSGGWLGATISSGGDNAPFLACAPRYVSLGNERIDPVGICYLTRNNFQDIKEYAPCRTRNWGYHRQGFCQAGLGAAVAENKKLFIGAPGNVYWQGQLFSIDPSVTLPYMPPRYKEYGEGQVYSHSLDESKTVYRTKEGPPKYDNSYLGYSVATGYFNGTEEQTVAVGMPRGDNLLGKVLLYTSDLTNFVNKTGFQMGGYFGYSLCGGDVDGDGFDDLIVGAPFFTPPNNEAKYEFGKVYIFYQGNGTTERFKKRDELDGINSKGRFGLSVASLGDINLDSIGDIVVGAPYDGVNGNGAVYIFHGAIGGIKKTPAQVIHAEQVSMYYRTFGFSVSGGVDLDGNYYNDLIVGAYDSNSATLFRSRPIVKMDAEIQFMSKTSHISLNANNCNLKSGNQNVSCIKLEYCLKYDGINLFPNLDFIININLDKGKPLYPRMYFLEYEGRNNLNFSYHLRINETYCSNHTVYLMNDVRDKLTPIDVFIEYYLDQNKIVHRLHRDPKSILQPIIDQNRDSFKKTSISIQKNCGPDNQCIPNLKLSAESNVKSYLLGSNKELIIYVTIQNSGEDAFEATYYLTLPAGIHYQKIQQLSTFNVPVLCSPINVNGSRMIKCDIGNPLPNHEIVSFNVFLEPTYASGMPLFYDFKMNVNTTNPESGTLSDNEIDMTVNIWVDTSFEIETYSSSADLHYNSSLYQYDNITHESQIGPQVINIYTFKNRGVSPIDEAEVYVSWPYETLAGDSLMYVLEEPMYYGNVKCEPAQHINDMKIFVDQNKKSYMQAYIASQKGKETYSGSLVGSSDININNAEGTVSSSFSNYSTTYTFTDSSMNSGNRGKSNIDLKKIVEEENKHKADLGDGSLFNSERARIAHQQGIAGSGISKQVNETYFINQNQNTGNNAYNTEFRWKDSVNGGSNNRDNAGSHENVNIRFSNHGQTNRGFANSGQTGGGFASSGQTGGGFASSGQTGGGFASSGQTGGGFASSGQTSGGFVNSGQTSGGFTNSGQSSGRVTGGYASGGQRVGGFANSEHIGGKEVIRTNTNSQDNVGGIYINRGQTGGGYGSNEKDYGTTRYENRTFYTAPRVFYSNVSIITDADGKIRRTESSTEYSLEEGDARIRGYDHLGRFHANSRNANNNAEENARGGTIHSRSGSYSSGTGSQFNSKDGYDSRDHYSTGDRTSEEGLNAGMQHKISTEEYVNQDLSNQNYYNFDNNRHGSDVDPTGFGAVAAGDGFRVGGLDLGIKGSSESGGSTSYAGQNTAGMQSGSSGQTQGYSSSHEFHRSKSYEGDMEGSHHQESEGRNHYSSPNRRGKRQLSEFEMRNENALKEAMACSGLRCSVLRCIVGPLDKNKEIYVGFRSRVNIKTLEKLSNDQPVELSSVGVIKVLKIPHIGMVDRPLQSEKAVTVLTPLEPLPEAEPVPLWVVVLSACAGTAILLLLIYAMYKCRFFERNRPETPERQPLNRNGYGHGDEQL